MHAKEKTSWPHVMQSVGQKGAQGWGGGPEEHPTLPAPAALQQPKENTAANTDLGKPSTSLGVLSIAKAPTISLKQQQEERRAYLRMNLKQLWKETIKLC